MCGKFPSRFGILTWLLLVPSILTSNNFSLIIRYFFVEYERDEHELKSHQQRQQRGVLPRPCKKETLSGVQRASQPDVSCPICDKKFRNG